VIRASMLATPDRINALTVPSEDSAAISIFTNWRKRLFLLAEPGQIRSRTT
jgi:hypothetical protein